MWPAHCYVLELQWDHSNTDAFGPLKCVLIRGVSSFQGANNTYLYEVGTWSSVLTREVSSFQGCPLRGVPLYVIMHFVLMWITESMENASGNGSGCGSWQWPWLGQMDENNDHSNHQQKIKVAFTIEFQVDSSTIFLLTGSTEGIRKGKYSIERKYLPQKVLCKPHTERRVVDSSHLWTTGEQARPSLSEMFSKIRKRLFHHNKKR